MFKLDNNFLTGMGLGSLPVDEKNKLLQAIYERLEMNVGMRLAENMTDEQLNEFEGFIDKSDEAGALNWLESNFPDYKQVVADELESLRAEISASAPQIIAAAQADPGLEQPASNSDSQQTATGLEGSGSSASQQPPQAQEPSALTSPQVGLADNQPTQSFTQSQQPTQPQPGAPLEQQQTPMAAPGSAEAEDTPPMPQAPWNQQ